MVERQIGSHRDGIPFYGPRSDLSGPEINNKLSGGKRSVSDSVFLGSSRDGMPKMVPDSDESSHLLKMLRSGGGERARRPYDEEMFSGMQSIRPTSGSTLRQPPSGNRTDAIISKWDRNIPLNARSAMQQLSRGGQFAPFVQQINSSRFRDACVGPSVISQPAADEGSRTGIKGSGILGSLNAKNEVLERNQPGLLPSGSRQKSDSLTADPEFTTPTSRQGLSSASRQMTIFYGGQAHVFDNVHPNKADVIMALAESSGGSWSTTYSPNSTIRGSPLEDYMLHGENEMGTSGNSTLSPVTQGRLPAKGNSPRGIASIDRMSLAPGDFLMTFSSNMLYKLCLLGFPYETGTLLFPEMLHKEKTPRSLVIVFQLSGNDSNVKCSLKKLTRDVSEMIAAILVV
ncbi:Tify domain [Dillenia turbinata]|uniref:Protein TIFY n=1 Tax=Dillenia turbinata TaxID=194707 RepID=A0AAN8UM66_9MAGN